MYWILLYLAIALEVVATSLMKFSNGFKNVTASVLMVMFYVVSLGLLTFSLKKLDVEIAYAIWSGLGTVAISLIGILFFHELFSLTKLLAIGLIIVGVVLLNLSATTIV